MNNFFHNKVYNFIPYTNDDFIIFKWDNIRNYEINFHIFIKPNNEKLKQLKNNVVLKDYIILEHESFVHGYDFPMNKDNEVDIESIDVTNFEAYKKPIDKNTELLIDVKFNWNWEYSIDYAFFIIEQIIDKENSNINLNYNQNHIELEKYLENILQRSNYYFSLSIENEYAMDYVIYLPLEEFEIKKELMDNIETKDYYIDEFLAKLGIYDWSLKLEIPNNYKMYELVSKYDKEWMIRSENTIDEVLSFLG